MVAIIASFIVLLIAAIMLVVAIGYFEQSRQLQRDARKMLHETRNLIECHERWLEGDAPRPQQAMPGLVLAFPAPERVQ